MREILSVVLNPPQDDLDNQVWHHSHGQGSDSWADLAGTIQALKSSSSKWRAILEICLFVN